MMVEISRNFVPGLIIPIAVATSVDHPTSPPRFGHHGKFYHMLELYLTIGSRRLEHVLVA